MFRCAVPYHRGRALSIRGRFTPTVSFSPHADNYRTGNLAPFFMEFLKISTDATHLRALEVRKNRDATEEHDYQHRHFHQQKQGKNHPALQQNVEWRIALDHHQQQHENNGENH